MKTKHFVLAVACFLMSTSLTNAQFFTNYTTLNGLPDDYVCGGLAVDANNHIWAGTSAGLAEFDGSSWHTYTTSDGLVSNIINCVSADSSGNIWIGTGSGVSQFDGSNWTTYTTADGLADNAVYYIFADNTDAVWFATTNGITCKNGAVWTSYSTSDGLLSNIISYITQAPDGNIWAATQMGGFARFNGSGFTSISVASIDSLSSDNVFALAVDDAGTQWVGTWSGISLISSAGVWQNNLHQSDGLFNDFVMDMKFASDGNLWVLCFDPYNTIGGLSGFDGSNWYSYSVAEGLAGNNVMRIAIDLNGDVWVATSSGISRLSGTLSMNDSEENHCISYPNPFNEVIEINTTESINCIEIFNTSGQRVYHNTAPETDTEISTKNWSPGLYSFCFVENGKRYFSKMVKE